jgi:hypothetical protein
LWPLSQRARLPQAWRAAPQVMLADPRFQAPPDVRHLPVSRALAGRALDALVQSAGCKTVLAWGQGAESLAQRLAQVGQACHVLRIPYQLSLV